MDAAAIASHIKDLAGLSGKDAQEILPMLEKFPYSSSLHILYLKALANDNSLEFETKLKIAAAHVSDKEHLYNLINDSNTTSEIEKIEEPVIETSEVEVEVAPEQIEVIEKEEETVKEAIDIIEEIEEKIESEVITESQIRGEVKEIIEEKTQETEETSIEETSLDEEIFSHAIASAFDIETVEIEDIHVVEDMSTNAEVESEIVKESKNDIIEPPEDMNFIEWLQFKKTGQLVKTEEVATPEVESEQEELTENQIPEPEEKKMSKKEINALLDRFISEQPSISKPVKDQYNPSSSAKESVEESTEVVSETLAQIHVMQGNYTKAIKAYKQLSLLYPEKKVFFASQIKKIESKLS